MRECSPLSMYHMSHVMCHVSHITCHVSHVRVKLLEGLLSTGLPRIVCLQPKKSTLLVAVDKLLLWYPFSFQFLSSKSHNLVSPPPHVCLQPKEKYTLVAIDPILKYLTDPGLFYKHLSHYFIDWFIRWSFRLES